MLSHANIFYQVDKFDFFVRLGPDNQTLSLLPPWHIYERAVGYYIFSCGCKQVLATGQQQRWHKHVSALRVMYCLTCCRFQQ